MVIHAAALGVRRRRADRGDRRRGRRRHQAGRRRAPRRPGRSDRSRIGRPGLCLSRRPRPRSSGVRTPTADGSAPRRRRSRPPSPTSTTRPSRRRSPPPSAAAALILDVTEVQAVLGAYGIVMPPARLVPADDALAAAEELGYPVAIKARHRHVGRSLKAGVALDLTDTADVVESVRVMREELGADADEVARPADDHARRRPADPRDARRSARTAW